MNSLKSFYSSLGSYCKFGFPPNSAQLTKIAIDISLSNPQSDGDVYIIVQRTCPNVRLALQEGLDNSDLRTLIALAMKIASKKA
jgi:hypothetical protein